MLTLPLLIFSGLSASVANGSNRIFMFIQAGAASVELWRQAPIPYRTAALWTLPTLFSALLGAYIATQIDSAQLKVGMGWLILISLMLIFVKKAFIQWRCFRQSKPAQELDASELLEPLDDHATIDALCESASLVSLSELEASQEDEEPIATEPLSFGQTIINLIILFVLGIYGGLIQAGLGAVLFAVLHKFCRLSKQSAMALKNVIIALYTLPVLILFFWMGQVAFLPGLVLAAGAVLGARLGALWARRISMPILMIVLYIVMFLSGLSLAFG